MKKLIIAAGVLLCIATTTTSCKKDYVCRCSKTYTSGSGSSTNDYSNYTYKDNRKRAEDRCNANESTSGDIFGEYSVNCQIQ
jgi:hypothetical protein